MSSGIKASKQIGFTLVELMISTSILMVVIFTGYYSYSLYSNSWEKRAGVFWQETNAGISIELLNKVISSCFPYIVESTNEPNLNTFLFQGTNDDITCISKEALFSSKEALVNIVFDGGEKSIYYRELPFDDYFLTKWPSKSFSWKHRILILGNVDKVNFRYFGYKGIEQAVDSNSDKAIGEVLDSANQAAYYSSYNSVERRVFPLSIEIELYSPKLLEPTTMLHYNFDRFSFESLLNYRQYQE
ncbi:prepilin-type N-terminal cleavage/methylation domain-containing protein [Pseudoalteromonas xiamenensis]|uniref:prepilin-type N-terminal cleavage/methylation domain-containing protein n=1 Tax=Pseudoalteromonas xiamenensis TaxID=882626 RepID=UPI0027E4FC20|nr:prepilin-type N-terminal cleavage/methylation domain-containing protein [Pseudoalteromonas xiamenensis]WMN61213.1 prepilin-type N-terminal cleavage/methylation domain-containing protein [Pseudoalteromonas xiamenensis]